MQLDQLYQEIILDHYKKPRGRGLREPYDVQVQHVNPTCGDEIDLRVQLEGDTVADVSYEGDGLLDQPGLGRVLYELVVGKSVTDGADACGRVHRTWSPAGARSSRTRTCSRTRSPSPAWPKYPARVKCALLAWMAFKDALVQAATATSDGAA